MNKKVDSFIGDRERTLRSLRSFGSPKSPKTRKNNGKEQNVLNRKERGAQPCPYCITSTSLMKINKVIIFYL